MDLTNMTSEELLSLRAAVSGELARRARENGVVLTDDERDLIRSGEHVRACKIGVALGVTKQRASILVQEGRAWDVDLEGR